MSYFGLIALFPSVLLLIAVVDAFLGWLDLHKWMIQRITALFPGSRPFLKANLDDIVDPSAAVMLSCVVVVIWSSTWIFSFMENALNRVWGVSRRRTFWESRVRSISMMVIGGSLLIISAAITAVVSRLQSRLPVRVSASAADSVDSGPWSLVLLSVGFLIAILVFSCVYKLIPDRKVLWTEALSGGVVAATVWEIGSYIFLTLIPHFDYQRVYGRTGAIIALLAWVYTSHLIMLFGASFSARLHRPAVERASDSRPPAPAIEVASATTAKVSRFPRRR